MGKFTYEQFEKECKRWDITVEEGYKAMCFTANILGEHFDNCLKYNQRIDRDPYNSSAVKNIAFAKLENAQKLMELYRLLDAEIYDVLETWADANDTTAPAIG